MTCSCGCAAARRPIVAAPSSNPLNAIANRLLEACIASCLHDRKLGELELGILRLGLDVAVAEALVGMPRIPWQLRTLRLRARRGQRKHQALGLVMGDVPGHLVVLRMS